MLAQESITAFIQNTFSKQNMHHVVIAVSGGIDSALSLTLLTQTLTPANITPIFLPYATQNIEDAKAICEWNKIPPSRWIEHNISPIVDLYCSQLGITETDKVRRGNIMARARMIVVYDYAKKMHALVCGTENKSEHYLGYFTRFGDAASDIEPISTLYKTQVQAMARELGIPDQIINKHPSAGLWDSQTDEQELGFSYKDIDAVLEQLIDKKVPEKEIVIAGISQETIHAVLNRIHSNAFKLQVPYEM
ncbi:MAG TPA: NAD+ synthase [Patescibacteria group bacterium]|nr:NAD+ synthase [Patescibacteria group bacterium]